MLALTRKNQESIIINGNIEITVLDIGDGKVKLGINAPREVEIHRKEVYDQIKESNKEATKAHFEQLDKLKSALKPNPTVNKHPKL